MFTTGLTQGQVLASIQAKLKALRDAAADVQELYKWSSGLQASDLESAPLSFVAADANTILSAISDMNAVAQILFTGQAPSTYPQVTGTPFVYAATSAQVIGPA